MTAPLVRAAMHAVDVLLLDAVLAIARTAGEAILHVYATDFEVTSKDDDSPLTQADLAAHRLIIKALAEGTPEIPCLSEEAADVPYEMRRGWSRYWLIDPLDGTREFVKKNGEFTVNIALIERGEPVLGVVLAPVTGTVWFAARGVGAFVEREGQRRPIRTRTTPPQPMLAISQSHRDAALDALLAKLPAHGTRSLGSSLKFCLVAEGEADLYPRTGPTSEWDTAAGQCVLEVAGGAVLRLPDLLPLGYNEKPSLLNPGFLAIGEPGYDWASRLAL